MALELHTLLLNSAPLHHLTILPGLMYVLHLLYLLLRLVNMPNSSFAWLQSNIIIKFHTNVRL